MLKKIIVFVLGVFLTGCIGDHYGLTKEEWSSLSQQQKQEAKDKYQQLVDNKNKQAQGNKIEKATTELVSRAVEKSNQSDN